MLTERQSQVAKLVADGLQDKAIAGILGIDEETVAYHIARIAKRWQLARGRNVRVQITQRILRAA